MNPALLAALINQIALPELTTWLRSRHAAGQGLTDADVLQKLITDTNLGEQIGEAWLAAHPVEGAGTTTAPNQAQPTQG